MATQKQRDDFLAAARSHYAADMLLKGTYGEGGGKKFKGCSIGCFAHDLKPRTPVNRIDDKHGLVAKHYGYPEWLAYLQDQIFEGLPNGESAKWHVHLAETLHALPSDYDWPRALHRVHVAILRISYRTAGSAQEAVKAVLDLHERAAGGEDISDEMWSAARSAAWSAAWSAAESAARSAARSAAWSAARSAAESAAWSAAWSAAFQEIRDAVLASIATPNNEKASAE